MGDSSRRVKRLVIVGALALLVTAGCSGGSDSPTVTGNSPPAPQSTSPTTPLTIEITSFAPSGTNVKVRFKATNHASGDVSFLWGSFVLTAPDGSKHTPTRPLALSSYTILGKGWTITGTGLFQFPKLKHGKYVISYAGTPLQTKTL